MKRLIDHYLENWKISSLRKPLLLRGARQISKTYAVRQLGKTFEEFVEINLEGNKKAHNLFEKDYDPERIIFELSLMTKKTIKPGTTLLFFDEIQARPDALIALRYFYEIMPDLHVIAAGSLLDFAIEKVGIPVGRVESLYMYPLSFMEFLAAFGEPFVIEAILTHNPEREIGSLVLDKVLMLVAQYLAFGGMPQVLQHWKERHNPVDSSIIHATVINSYRQDFGKYARQSQVKYVELLFESVPIQLGGKFKYSRIEGDYRKRDLAPAFDLLTTAGVAHKVYHSSGQGIPLGAQIDPQNYKAIFLDVGLGQGILGFDIAQWFLQPLAEFVNKGSLVEAFIGQEILAYGNPHRKKDLYYWHRETRSRQAEVDYLIQSNGVVIPVEVKSGSGSTLRSMQAFLTDHKNSPYGIRFSTQDYSAYGKIYSYPLFAVAKIFADDDQEVRDALKSLM